MTPDPRFLGLLPRRLTGALLVLLLAALWAAPAAARSAGDAAESAAEVTPLLVGSTVPSVSLRTIEGDVVDLLEDARKKPSILVFYRGGW